MLEHIRAKVIDELRARDYARGIPRDGKCYTVEMVDGVETARVDPDLSRRVHSGGETNRLTSERWREFCAAPRDVAVEMANLGHMPAADDGPTMHMPGFAPAITEAIRLGIAAGVESAMRLSQGNGRPESPAGGKPPPAKSRTAEPRTVEATT